MTVVLVTGGGSGIGAGLAAAFHARGAAVVIAGPTPARLDAVAARHPEMETEPLDVADPASVAACVQRVVARHPELDTVVSSAGVQTLLDFANGAATPEAIAHEVAVNLTGTMLVAQAALPHLRTRPRARLVLVGSGLAFAPRAAAPVYSATKAATHAFARALRRQLRGGSVQVVELIPPVVSTDLHRGQPKPPPGAMPVDAFVTAAMAGLDAGRDEIAVGLARVLRIGARVAPTFFEGVVNRPR